MSDQFISNWLRRPKLRQALGYLLAVASVGLAFVAATTFLHYHLPLAIMSFSFCAIAITFWYAGIGPGILALVLAVLIRTFFFQPEVDWISRIAYDLVFALFSFFMLQATRAKNHLEWIVSRRTAALTRTNEALQQEVAERKRAEEALQQNVKALQNALEEIQVLKDQLYKENLALREEIDVNRMFEEIVGSSPALQVVLSRVAKVAPTDSTVLVTGETGTGKELVARAIHKRSQRASRAFVSVNCAAIPRDLIASELFGHEKGAFTGATQRRLGRFESADGGTIFLDEIGELPAEMQIALLRVLQEREFQRVGGNESIKTDVRVVTATNRNLQTAIAEGRFRDDLFYRLEAASIPIPPLRERIEDVPALTAYFISYYNEAYGKQIHSVSRRALALLESHGWPGNVRELAHALERATLLSDDDRIDICDLPPDLLVRMKEEELELSATQSAGSATRDRSPAAGMGGGDGTPLGEALKAAVERSLSQAHGDSAAAAKLLGISRSSLYRKIARFGIKRRRRPVPTTNRLKSAG